MIVAIDATPLSLTSGGLKRYTAELSLALAANYPEDTIYLVSDQPFARPDGPANLRAGGAPRNALERRWWSWGVGRELSRLGAGLFHGTNFEVPLLASRPAVLTVHDLSPWMDPRWHSGADRVRRRAPGLLRMGLATMVITDSEAVRRDAIDRFALHPSRVAAVPLAAAPCFQPVPAPAAAAPYFLYAGTLEPRKNIAVVLEAWRGFRTRHPEVELVLAGRRREDFPPVPAQPGLRVLGEVAEADLPSLYSGALACLYPSLYEGFGLPVLEAMQCGAPVIASRDAAVMEVSGGAALNVDASDARLWAGALECALLPEWRRKRAERGVARAKEFSWARTARLTREVYAEAAARFGR